ncbi:MAG: nuclear transport factor 2 family protein, partial [Pseudomonadales bacterium]|nr:nuclear transport factor 2 family protein [Pseudomonadales bacterium]
MVAPRGVSIATATMIRRRTDASPPALGHNRRARHAKHASTRMSNAYPPELQELIDKQAIRDLLAAYFTAADRHDNVKMAALYHDDATDDHGS